MLSQKMGCWQIVLPQDSYISQKSYTLTLNRLNKLTLNGWVQFFIFLNQSLKYKRISLAKSQSRKFNGMLKISVIPK